MSPEHYAGFVAWVFQAMGVYDSELNTLVNNQLVPPWDSVSPFFYEGELRGSLRSGTAFWQVLPTIVSDTTWTLNLPGRHHWIIGSDMIFGPDGVEDVLLPRCLGGYLIFLRPLANSNMQISHKGDCVLGGVSMRYHFPMTLAWNTPKSQDVWGYEHVQLNHFCNRGYLTGGGTGLYDSGDPLIRGFQGSNYSDVAVPSTHSLIIQNDVPVWIRMVLSYRSYLGQLNNGVFNSGDGTW